ncbi:MULTISPECIES: hypothetical protein [Aliivibrio]|uniref:hypothetical protein n=1 Tax=Aliivibrio TaxID=511678 RepID=UPI00080E54AF|nr:MULTISPECIES: hypothetical protein [Aliivibrio]MBD1569110.1 hypothetical protein [Aliivibrio sp. S10_S31]OCH07872.1 hypothetical protein A6E11_13030 [Aliivibrio fischeri]
MCSASTVSDATSADKSSIGFDYQYYFFLWKVLCLHPGQSAGLEYKDDVHTDLDNDIQVLYQLKHTVQKSKATGKPSNLTSLDLDLWKTLFNWAQLIQDESAGRALPNEQLNFLQKTIFVLASNKSETRNNTVASFIDDITNGEIHPSNIKNKFSQLTKDSKSKDIGKYSEKILSLSNDVLYNFFKCVKFELEQDDIIKKCHDAIKSKMIEDRHIESVFKLIDSSIKESNFITIKANSKVVISFDEFHKRYRKYFQQFQNSDLKIYEFEESLPSGMESLTFIKQLIEINDFDTDDLDTIVEFTSLMLKAQKNINNWYSNGELTDIELSSLKQNTLTDWKNSWRRKYRNFDESSHNTLALDLVDSMRSKTITYDVLPNDITISNGYLYSLSETPDIGWRKDWEKYKK